MSAAPNRSDRFWHLPHRLLGRVFRITAFPRKPISYLPDIQLDVFRFWESATQLLPAFAQEALRLFPTHEKDTQAANHTDSDSNEESFHYTVHVSSSFLL
jgi:hypothetical protein